MEGKGHVWQWGFAILIAAAALGLVALDACRSKYRAASTSGSRFSSYENPIEGTRIQANWKTYKDGRAVRTGLSSEPTHRDVIFLSPDDVFNRNLTAEDLATFLRGVQAALEAATSTTSASYRLLVQVTLSAQDPPAYEFFTVGEAPPGDRPRILDGLKMLAPLHTARDPVKLQLWHFTDQR